MVAKLLSGLKHHVVVAEKLHVWCVQLEWHRCFRLAGKSVGSLVYSDARVARDASPKHMLEGTVFPEGQPVRRKLSRANPGKHGHGVRGKDDYPGVWAQLR